MSRRNNRSGFTLIEVLIVVIIMAVLAATIIPQFSSSTDDAKESTLKFNLRTMRAQIEMYRIHHGSYPLVAQIEAQLTGITDPAGNPAAQGFGPYMDELPLNPYDMSTTVTAVSAPGTPPAGPNGTPGGWQYDELIGMIYPNHTGWVP